MQSAIAPTDRKCSRRPPLPIAHHRQTGVPGSFAAACVDWFRQSDNAPEIWGKFVGYDTGGVKYVTRIERFQAGDYPMVCVRSGLPATKMVPVQARRSTVWPWFLLPISLVWFAVAKWAADSDHPWGKLPFAEGQVNGITATYEKSIGVIINGAHADFVEATRRAQAAQQPADPPRDPVALGDPLMSSGADR